MSKQSPQIGKKVTCKYSVEASYSGYANQPVCFFNPGNVGTVVDVDIPYVSRRGRFIRVEFYKDRIVYNAAHGGSPWSVGLGYDNFVILSAKSATELTPLL